MMQKGLDMIQKQQKGLKIMQKGARDDAERVLTMMNWWLILMPKGCSR
jgi:hypothetical protein